MSSIVATCRFYRAPGGCVRGDDCNYRHHRPLVSGNTQISTEGTITCTDTSGVEERSSSVRPTQSVRAIDAPRLCKWFAAGYCRRGKSCWFRHDVLATSSDEAPAKQAVPAAEDTTAPLTSKHIIDAEECGICYDTPEVFGLLGKKCKHDDDVSAKFSIDPRRKLLSRLLSSVHQNLEKKG